MLTDITNVAITILMKRNLLLFLHFSSKTFTLSALRPLSKFCSVIYDKVRGKKNVSICVANNNDLKRFLSLFSPVSIEKIQYQEICVF